MAYIQLGQGTFMARAAIRCFIMTRVEKRLQPVRERHARMSKNRFLKELTRNVQLISSSTGGDALRICSNALRWV
jgi:hypothetical protein